MQKSPPSGVLERPLAGRDQSPNTGLSWSLNAWELGVVFVGCYLFFERVSLIHPWASTGITAWSPQVALVFGLVLLRGLRAVPAVLVAMLLAEALVRVTPAPLTATVLGTAVMALGYAVAGVALSRRLTAGSIRSLRDFAWMLGIVALAPALIGMVHVAICAIFEQIEWTEFPAVLLRYWIGDVVGVIALLPLMLVLAARPSRRKLAALLPRWETAVQFGSALAILGIVFVFLPGAHVKYFFVLFLPLIWIAARHGLVGAAVAIAFIQTVLIAGVVMGDVGAGTLLELQARMLALSVTGLLLGVVVDERERAQERLRQSLRLAAAGEMAAALAHEVNQPLTALVSYGRACQHMLAQAPPDVAQLTQTVGKLTEQAQRVGAIVKRLRDFLRSGTMNLEPLAPGEFLRSMHASFDAEASAEGIALTTRVAPDLPRIMADRLELEIVLRNLIANAMDSIREAAPATREVKIEAARHDHRSVRLSVIDSGPGIAASMRDRLFHPFSTSKSHGMGLGLAISRAIVTAHGGRLWVEPARFGSFHLTVPILSGESDDSAS